MHSCGVQLPRGSNGEEEGSASSPPSPGPAASEEEDEEEEEEEEALAPPEEDEEEEAEDEEEAEEDEEEEEEGVDVDVGALPSSGSLSSGTVKARWWDAKSSREYPASRDRVLISLINT